jgi:uncharacterized membrane protein YdjX (TVP38/TMEM64 family)
MAAIYRFSPLILDKKRARVMTDMSNSKNMGPDMGAKSGVMRHLPLLVILVVAVLGAITLRDYLTFDTLRDNREALVAFRDSNYVMTAILFLVTYILIVGFSLPGGTLCTLTGGFLFGTVIGAAFSVTGATIGAAIIFLAARYGFGEKLGAKLEASTGPIKKIKDGIDENQWSMLFLIRLVPVVPFFMANLIPAFMQVPLHRFVVSTFFGIVPATAVFSSIGAGLGEVFAAGETPNLRVIFEPHILLPILGIAALALMPVVIKAVAGKKGL